MVTTQPPVVVAKKRGCGCFGCGCLVAILILLLIGAMIAGFWYMAGSFISTAPINVPTFDGGDAVYQSAAQKINTFNQALQQNQPASLELSADEINTLIARNPSFAANHLRFFVTMFDDHADLQMSVSTDVLSKGLIKDRYLNGDTDFSLHFDATDKELHLILHHLKVGAYDLPEDSLSSSRDRIDHALNQQLETSPAGKQFLDHAQTVEIRAGQLEIEEQ